MKDLIEKRNALEARAAEIKKGLEDSKRAAYNNEERTELNSILIEMKDINERMKLEKDLEEQRNFKLDSNVKDVTIVSGKKADDLVQRTNSEFIKFLNGEEIAESYRSKNGNFFFPSEYFTQRATVTDDSKLTQVATKPLSVIEKGLTLQKLGATIDYATGGAFKAPYLASTPASYNSEDSSNADQTWTAGKYDIIPAHSSASYELTGTYLKSVSPATVSKIMDSLQNRIFQGLEKRAIEHVIANASTINSVTGGTFYAAMLALEKAVEYGSGYLYNKASGELGKLAKKDSGSGQFVYDNNATIGYPSYTSSLFTGNTVIFGDWSMVNMTIWDGIEVNIMQDVAAKRKGNYILIADAFSDGKLTNPYAFAVANNVNNAS